MMTVLLTHLLSFALAATSPIQSKEEVQFESKSENQLLDLFKSDAYLGVLGRPNEKIQDLQLVDLYTFKETQQISLDESLCKDLLAQIYGPLDKITLQLKSVKIYTSHTGKTCEAQLDDPARTSKIPERRTIIGFLKVKPYALVFKLSKKSDTTVQENARQFWESLH